MLFSPILAVSFIMTVVAVLFIICAVGLVLIVLIQKGKGGGLTGALGGGAMSGILGSQTKGPLTWITIGLACMFLMLAVVMAKFYRPDITDFGEARPPAVEDTGTTTSDANEGGEANSLGAR